MSRRKAMLLAAGLLLVVGVAGWWLNQTSGERQLQLTFVGYTNAPVMVRWARLGVSEMMPRPLALVQASNSSSVIVELFGFSPSNVSSREFAHPMTISSTVLKPGETALISAYPGESPWWTEIDYRKRGLKERVLQMLWRGVLRRTGWRTQLHRARCGPITNAVPPSPLTMSSEVITLPEVPFQRRSPTPFNVQELLTNYYPMLKE